MPPSAPPGPDQSSPETAAESFRSAMSARDWRSALLCLVPESRASLVAFTYYGAAHLPHCSEPAGLALAALIDRHGLDEARETPFELDALVRMLDDIQAWSERFLPADRRLDLAERAARTTYTEFSEAGESAYAIATCDGRRSQQRFVRREGRWFAS